jgi:autotransporter strand-loop-strand O-heptosyltransferase
MKIAQINPGLLPIPPNGWGAVEKIIWEYTLVLRKMGHTVDIKYLNEINSGDYDIVHVHMANLAIELRDRKIPYIFSMHDHHVSWFGQSSECYKKNLEAIKGSDLTFLHAKSLIDYFGSKKAVYLEHGVNINEYANIERSIEKPKLLCLANNGFIGAQEHDRKGFRLAIKAAEALDLPITVAGPKNNKNFFDANKDLLDYANLTILYDLNQDASVQLFSNHHIFLHPSELEAGHPNLTLLEAASTGMPIVGCMEEEMAGMLLIDRNDKSAQDILILKIKEAIHKYPALSRESRENAEYHSWEVVVSKMLEHYEETKNWNMGKKLIEAYQTTPLIAKKPRTSNPLIIKYGLLPDYIKVNTEIAYPGAGLAVLYKNGDEIRNFMDHGQESRRWSAVSHYGEWCNWEIVFKRGSKILKTEKMNLEEKLVGINAEEFDLNILLAFKGHMKCNLILVGNFTEEQKEDLTEHGIACTDKASRFDFWFSWATILNWKELKDKKPIDEKTLIFLRSGALGDTIAFVESCQNWKETHGNKPTVAINPSFIDIFRSYDLDFIDKNKINSRLFSDIIVSDYHFDIPLQYGFQEDLGLDFVKRRPQLNFKPSTRPILGKYICFSTHSTAQAKYWNYPNGWEILCKMLRKAGVTPVCIDRYESFGIEGHWNPVPKSSVKKQGLLFQDIMNFMHHSELYVGLSSGHSWLAHGLGKKTVMILGPTDNEYEEDNYKIKNESVCNGCFHKPDLYPFDPNNWMWCPMHKNTERHHECTKTITPETVFQKIMELL